MKRYNQRQAAKQIRKKKQELAALKGVKRTPVSTKKMTVSTSKTSKVKQKKVARPNQRSYRTHQLSGGWVIGSGIVLFVAVVVFLGLFVFDIELPNRIAKKQKVVETAVAATPAIILTNGVRTDFVRKQVTANMMINDAGNFVTVENSVDNYFMDLIFTEVDIDGNIVNKKVISSEYALYTYITRYCNDIIEVQDGYLLTGYTQRGDYASGSSDINLWLAKFDKNANLVWERVIDDGYLKAEGLSLTKIDENRYQLYINTESLKRWFMIIDGSGETLESFDLNEEFITYAATHDGGKIFVKERNDNISILEKVDSHDAIQFEQMVVGAYNFIYDVPEGYLLFGYKEINHHKTAVAVMTDKQATILWEKPISSLGSPYIKDVLYQEGTGYILTGYIFATNGTGVPRQVQSLFDDTKQDIQDAWVAKLDDTYDIAWERTYAYGDMGAYFNSALLLQDNTYYLTGIAQCQGDDAVTIIKESIVTQITDKTDTLSENFMNIVDEELTDKPKVLYVGSSAINNRLLDRSKLNDYALKVYWTSVVGAKKYLVNIYKNDTQIYSVITNNNNSLVLENVLTTARLVEQIAYTAVVTAIDNQNASVSSDPLTFVVYNNRYAMVRNWIPSFNQGNKLSSFFYRLESGIRTVDVSRYQVDKSGYTKLRSVTTSTQETIAEDMAQLGYGTYFYRLKLLRDDNTTLTIDTPVFSFTDPDPEQNVLNAIKLNDARLMSDVGLTTEDIANLKLLIHLGQFSSSNRSHVRLLQLFINYYLGDLVNLGEIYSPATEPASNLDIPVIVNHYYQEDTRKAMVYLLAYFGRSGIDGEELTRSTDEAFFADLAKLNKLPVSNDIIAAFRSYGDDAKYNAGYSFDTSYNILQGEKLALPVDHEPQKSAYFGIRYFPLLNGEAYDTGPRLHAGLDFRSEDMIEDDVAYIESHAGETYIDNADLTAATEQTTQKTRREVIRDRIYTPYDGVVVKVDNSSTEVGNGIHVMIKHVSKNAEKTVFYSQYLHLSSTMCQVGQVIKRGEVLGTMGNTGYSEAKHLHVELFTERMHVCTFLNPLIYDYAYPPLKQEALDYEKLNGLD